MEKRIDVDFDYHKAPRFKKGRFLPFVIYQQPEEITTEHRDKNKTYYPIFNETKIKEWMPSHKSTSKDGIYIYIGVFVFFSIFLPIVTSIRNGEVTEMSYLLVYLFIGIPFLILAYNQWKKHKTAPEQTYVTFNRLNGLITMPKSNRVDYFTIPFTHLKATSRAMMRSKYSYTGPELQFFIDTRSWRPWYDNDYLMMSAGSNKPKVTWSLYVWYMDKNRPLPPGTAFDDFREADFQRRKKEGFPPPLFKSLIPTPEFTVEQQVVREAYWKDEDYIPSKKEAYFNVSPFSKHYKRSHTGELKEDSFE